MDYAKQANITPHDIGSILSEPNVKDRRLRKEKIVHVLLIESESQRTIDEATKQLSNMRGVNYMQYSLGDSYLRIVFSALGQAAVSTP